METSSWSGQVESGLWSPGDLTTSAAPKSGGSVLGLAGLHMWGMLIGRVRKAETCTRMRMDVNMDAISPVSTNVKPQTRNRAYVAETRRR